MLRRLEGAALAAVAAALFYLFEGQWKWFGLFFLAPDLAFVGYVRGKRIGAMCYNAAHNIVLPLILGGVAAAGKSEWLPAIAIWIAHIGFDRTCGFDLKDTVAIPNAPRQAAGGESLRFPD